jgi:hypothetical protein
VLCIGHLAIEVIGVLDSRANVHVEDADPRLVRIWPAANSKVMLPAERFVGIVDDDLV